MLGYYHHRGGGVVLDVSTLLCMLYVGILGVTGWPGVTIATDYLTPTSDILSIIGTTLLWWGYNDYSYFNKYVVCNDCAKNSENVEKSEYVGSAIYAHCPKCSDCNDIRQARYYNQTYRYIPTL